MKTINVIILAIIFTITGLFNSNKAKAQAVEQGTVVIDVFYGWPNMVTGLLRIAYANGEFADDVKVGSIGPIGGRFEYLLSDNLGVGLDFIYANSSVSWTGIDDLDSTLYNYEVSNPRIRIIPTFKYHFVQNERVDFYGVFGIGYKNSKLKFESDYNGWNPSAEIGLGSVAYRLAVGTRFFFTDNIGMNVEFGLGSALATGGITVKF